MNANERFEYMAEQFYKKTGMLAPGKDDAMPRDEEYKKKVWREWAIFAENFYSNLFQSHAEMYNLLERLTSHDNCKKDIIHLLGEADNLLAKARGEKC